MTHADIGIVVVTYNSAREVGACLDAAARTGCEIVVVDNASTDGTVDEVRRRGVRCVANRDNRGFAAAVNQGFVVLNRPFILLLNPDAVLVSTDLGALREACEFRDAAGAGGKLLDSENRPQVGFMVRRFPTPAALIMEALLLNRVCPQNRVNRRYRGLDLDYSKRSAVEQPAGAFLMLRRDVWQELSGFDEGFHPLWFEEVDFCRRARDRGYRMYYEPSAVAKHTGGHSIGGLSLGEKRFYWYRSLLKYSARHFGSRGFRAVCLAVAAGSVPRALAETLLARRFEPLAVYGRVVRLAARSLIFGWREEAAATGLQ